MYAYVTFEIRMVYILYITISTGAYINRRSIHKFMEKVCDVIIYPRRQRINFSESVVFDDYIEVEEIRC